GRVIDKLADMSINTLFDSKTGALGSLITSAFSGTPKFAEGGYTGAGGKYQPAGVVHRGEYVFDQQSVRAAGGPAVLDGMRAGLKGYASGGAVSMPSPSALLSSVQRPVANGTAPPRVTVNNYNAPAGYQGDAKVSTGADGSMQVDVLWRQLEDRMAQSVTKRGNLGRAMEARYGLNPTRGQGR
ncbi:hypothetical protein KIP89_03070, partial [Ancylobacter sp. VKM B-3255]|nr:hypothetical protein [Ancylobacter radicis]